jgi:hypothetical protein
LDEVMKYLRGSPTKAIDLNGDGQFTRDDVIPLLQLINTIFEPIPSG